MSQYDFPGSNPNIRFGASGGVPDDNHNCLEKAVGIDMRRIVSTEFITYVAVVECSVCTKRRTFEFKEEMN